MQFEWDKAKNRANLAKHGVDFADAVAVFEDGLALTRPDPEARNEPRFVTIGVDGLGRHLVIVYTERLAHSPDFGARRDQTGAQVL